MKAIAFTEFGGPDVLRVIDLPTPEPGPGQVRVRVRAAGFNAIDAKLRSGSFGELKGGFPAVPGIDVVPTRMSRPLWRAACSVSPTEPTSGSVNVTRGSAR